MLKDILKDLRESKGLNKQELANRVGISRSYISTIESGKVTKPTIKTLKKIAYVFDPDNEEYIYERLLSASGYDTKNSQEDFQNYIDKLNKKFNENEKFDPSLISSMKYRVNRDNNSVVFLDKPYMNILWILEQKEFEVYLGHEPNEYLIDENGNKYNKPLALNKEEQLNLLSQIREFQNKLISHRQESNKNKDYQKLLSKTEEYSLLFDLLEGNIEKNDELISRLAIINDNREVFLAEEYYDELKKAAKEKDALKLRRLIRMNSFKELNQYLKSEKQGDHNG
ncbi:helix-turn-helix transcriptional regulator [Staphylococcus simulans]|uniref:helix-turn-helix transcriptional regulator n=1 Tax=Staphylococcus simulans TaxID=1286 RepID=UPI00079661C9|nr:helix-turn-helix transcriptional regulator [Staphylococcus simulans]KXA45390.1 DNA-binding helix-turn-helix protein [Staphylococcus simulans]